MRLLVAIVLACCATGCGETRATSTTYQKDDGSTFNVAYETQTRLGVRTVTKTESTIKRGTATTVVYDKMGGEWVKRE
jgi:hypothetical protein